MPRSEYSRGPSYSGIYRKPGSIGKVLMSGEAHFEDFSKFPMNLRAAEEFGNEVGKRFPDEKIQLEDYLEDLELLLEPEGDSGAILDDLVSAFESGVADGQREFNVVNIREAEEAKPTAKPVAKKDNGRWEKELAAKSALLALLDSVSKEMRANFGYDFFRLPNYLVLFAKDIRRFDSMTPQDKNNILFNMKRWTEEIIDLMQKLEAGLNKIEDFDESDLE